MATRKITVRRCKVNGKSMWKVRRWENGKPRRTFFHSKREADAEAAALTIQVNRAGEVWMSLNAGERERLIAAYLNSKNGSNSNGHGLGVGDVIEELRQSRLNNGAAAEYVKTLVIVLKQFARGRERLQISKVSLGDVEAFLDSKSLNYRSTVRGRLSALFSFAVRRGYRLDNPCDRLESVKVVRPPPAVFSPDEVKAAVGWMLQHARYGLAWFALSTVCGLRPEEAEKTEPGDINFDEGFVKVEAQTTKVRQRRVVYPKPEAMAFLKWAIAKGGRLPLGGDSRRTLISGRKTKSSGLRGALGFKAWPKDITRHTAASYWLGCEDATVKHVAKMLGHSERTCETRYKAVITQKQASEFWKMINSLAT